MAVVTISLVAIISVAVYYVKVKRKTFSMSTNAAYSRKQPAQYRGMTQENKPRDAIVSSLQAVATTESSEGEYSEINENLTTGIAAHNPLAFELSTNIAYIPRQGNFECQDYEYDYIGI